MASLSEEDESEKGNGSDKQSSVIDTNFAEKNEGVNGPITARARKHSAHGTHKATRSRSKLKAPGDGPKDFDSKKISV